VAYTSPEGNSAERTTAGPASLPDASTREASTSATDGTVTVASLNLHCGVSSRGHPYDVTAAILKLDAQLIALQETWSDGTEPDLVATAAQALGAQLFRVPLFEADSRTWLSIPGKSGPGRLGMAVLTTLRVTGYEVRDLGRMRGDFVRRCAQILTVEVPGHAAMRLAGTHLTHRLASPVQLGHLVRHLNGRTVPTVIAGDLNMPRLLAAGAPGYLPAVRGRTFPADLPLLQLDHILSGHSISRLNGCVLPAAGSDHLPVRARLRLPVP
jgi:endonuclease/exonuclease/phosphatase family metal-dependent hydrolase